MGFLSNAWGSKYNPITQAAAAYQLWGGPVQGSTWAGTPISEKITGVMTPRSAYAAESSVLGNQTQSNVMYRTPEEEAQLRAFDSANQAKSGGGGGNLSSLQTGQSSGSNLYNEAQGQVQDQARLELEQALTEYDRYSAEAQAQRGVLGTERTSALSSLETGFGRAQTEAGKAKTEAKQQTLSAKNKALTTAQDVQRKNRNVLRALGILSSSAAGEMLGRPMEEYGEQAGNLEMNLIKRKDQVTDWLQQRLVDYNQNVQDVNDKYTQLVENIDRDLRFNDRQRITAVKAAQQAAQQAVTQLRSQAMAYQQAAQQYNANILTQIAQIKLYQNPQADVSGILSSLINQGQQGVQPQQVGTQETEEARRRRLGLLGSTGLGS